MKIFIIKDNATGDVLWSGCETLNGMVMMAPSNPDIGLPTVYINWEKFVEAQSVESMTHISWRMVETE